jgi:hypothetical protein
MDERILIWQLEGPIDRQLSDRVTALLQSKLTIARAAAAPRPGSDEELTAAKRQDDLP